jgi:hypothetical protein
MAVKLGLLHHRKNTDIVLTNGVLRKILGPKDENVTEDCRKLHNEKLHGLSPALNIIWLFK